MFPFSEATNKNTEMFPPDKRKDVRRILTKAALSDRTWFHLIGQIPEQRDGPGYERLCGSELEFLFQEDMEAE